MSRSVRAVVAFFSVLAFATVPLIADWCAISCEAAHSTTAADAPTCHHAGSSMLLVGHVPTPCGHDHHPIVVDAAARTLATARARTVLSLPASTPDVVPAIAPLVAMTSRAGPRPGPSTPPLPLALSSALRI